MDKELINKEAVTLIEEHLQRCSHCRSELNSLISIKDLISQKERITPKDDFLIRLKSRLRLEGQIIRIRWIVEIGNLARRLIFVPATIMILIVVLVFGRQNGISPVDDYIFGDLSNEEIGILSGYYESYYLLTKMIFKD
jgi:predicted anti-sigma-YlaC factor YlaD